jgi:hypothetical protein
MKVEVGDVIEITGCDGFYLVVATRINPLFSHPELYLLDGVDPEFGRVFQAGSYSVWTFTFDEKAITSVK